MTLLNSVLMQSGGDTLVLMQSGGDTLVLMQSGGDTLELLCFLADCCGCF